MFDPIEAVRDAAGWCDSYLGSDRCILHMGHDGNHEADWGGLACTWSDDFALAHRIAS